MPMGKTSTPITNSLVDIKVNVKQHGPKSATLNFIKQFARVYSYEPKLGTQLGNFIAN